MEHDSTLYGGPDVHKDSITVAYALGSAEVELLGKIGTTQTDIDNGVVNILVGFAPLKPAEFVVIQIEQLTGQASAKQPRPFRPTRDTSDGRVHDKRPAVRSVSTCREVWLSEILSHGHSKP